MNPYKKLVTLLFMIGGVGCITFIALAQMRGNEAQIMKLATNLILVMAAIVLVIIYSNGGDWT